MNSNQVIENEPCSCIKKNFNLVVSSPDRYSLEILDVSEWMSGEQFKLSTSYGVVVEVNIPQNKFNINLKSSSTSLLTQEDFGLSGQDVFPQGIYTFKVEADGVGCGVTHKIYKAVLSSYQFDYNNLLIKEDFSSIKHLGLLIEKIKINTDIGNIETAKELFKVLKEEMSLYSCSNC